MIAFKVHLNGEQVCTAGVTAGVLTAILSWVGDNTPQHGGGSVSTGQTGLVLHTGALEAEGMQAGQHLKWADDRLKVGDTILIRVVETDTVDSPVSREPTDPDVAEKGERIIYEGLREKYGDTAR